LAPFTLQQGLKEPNYADSVWINCRNTGQERTYLVIVERSE
jgi:hypothetical protein